MGFILANSQGNALMAKPAFLRSPWQALSAGVVLAQMAETVFLIDLVFPLS